MSQQSLSDLIVRLEAATTKIESIAALKLASANTNLPHPLQQSPSTVSKSVTEFKIQIIDALLADFISASAGLGDHVQQQTTAISAIIQHTYDLLDSATKQAKPNDWPSTQSLIQPLTSLINQVVTVKDTHKGTDSAVLSAIADGVPAFGWICMDPKPSPYISDMKDAAQFYINRIIKENKNTPNANTQLVKYVHAWANLLSGLLEYVKVYHPTGIKWTGSGSSTVSAGASKGSNSNLGSATSVKSISGGNSLFDQLNQGANITSSLKKVVKDNTVKPQVVPTNSSAKPAVPATLTSPTVKQGNMALQGNKYIVENYTSQRDLVISDTSIKTVVYIFGCTDCSIEIKGKVNSITIDNCKKSALLIDSIVSTIDLINTKSITLQINGQVPTISVENSDNSTIYLSNMDCVNACQIMTCKSSELNVMVPKTPANKLDAMEYTECPVPEQFKTTFSMADGVGKFVTVPVEHKG